MSFTITRHVPSRNETLTVIWVTETFIKMTQDYRKMRKRIGGDPMDACYLCDYKFQNDDTVGLACFVGLGNKVVCPECCKQMTQEAGKPERQP